MGLRPTIAPLHPSSPERFPAILDAARGPLDPPIGSEIFAPDRFEQHGRSLAVTHLAVSGPTHRGTFFPRLGANIDVLREAQMLISARAGETGSTRPASEWLLDNFYLVEAQLARIRSAFPRRYFRDLPVLVDAPLAGLPRIYGVAWAFVAHTDGAFDTELLLRFLGAYQEVCQLTLGEQWALPTTLRVVLIENLRRLAERLAAEQAAREIAEQTVDEPKTITIDRLDTIVGRLRRRGVDDVFLLQLSQRLHAQPNAVRAGWHEWLARTMPDRATTQQRSEAREATANRSMGNAIGSLRLIDNADWLDIVEQSSATLKLLLRSPSFAAESAETRNDTLHAVERLARRSNLQELEVARAAVSCAHAAPPGNGSAVGHWLKGPGRAELESRLGVDDPASKRWHRWLEHAVLPLYLAALMLGTVGIVAWALSPAFSAEPNGSGARGWVALAAVLMLFPASEAAVAVLNRLISESTRPSRLPRLALANGIPVEHRVMVVIPGLLIDADTVDELSHRLELHSLANPERHAQFALLTDGADATTAVVASDAPLLEHALRNIAALNARHIDITTTTTTTTQADDFAWPRFILLHRARSFSETEQRWIGWERKRGKIEQLVTLLATQGSGAGAIRATHEPDMPFLDLGAASRVAPGTRYVVTLDGDTQLPPGRLRALVGVAAHPDNLPHVDPVTRVVTRGYGILQPRVVTPLPARDHVTLYHWLFAGQCGVDPYSAASSEVYQDVFREGTFTGKGLLNVDAMHAVLTARLPPERVLSHDLLEGSIARCAAVTDITVIEEAPFHAEVGASRIHRWTRGDWQLLPLMFGAATRGVRGINRWKMVDNLRRSLVAPLSTALVVLSLATGTPHPMQALALVFGALVAGPLLGAVAGLAPSRDDVAKVYFYRQAGTEVARAICGGLWLMAQMLYFAMLNLDAVGRVAWRLVATKRHLLEWKTSAAAQAGKSADWRSTLRRHRAVPLVALVLWLLLWLAGSPFLLLASTVCVLWALSPLWTGWVSRQREADAPLPDVDALQLDDLARDTWRLFERCIGPGDHHLPPDNLQLTPETLIAHRTSPTNIGLYLLSAACARRFGWISSHDLVARLEATLASLEALLRHRGHFLNWYDTERLAALLPAYVSTVDSGNLSGCLLAVAEACRELAHAPFDPTAARRAVTRSKTRTFEAMQAAGVGAVPEAVQRLLDVVDPFDAAQAGPAGFADLLDQVEAALASRMGDDTAALAAAPEHRWAWCVGDHVAALRGVLADFEAERRETSVAVLAEPANTIARRLVALSSRCDEIAWEADFSFLYQRTRKLLHIGYRVADAQLDASFYDLLASEARLTSLLAIAKGDVPVNHWSALGRSFHAVGAHAGLKSWSGSMFEYLMPTLLLDEPHGSMLRGATQAAVTEQIRFAKAHHVPWGISESAHAVSDHTLAYQYGPQGVPRLALRRAPADELVIAPYATALAAQVVPHLAVSNFVHIGRLAPVTRYGFIEALDLSPGRQIGAAGFIRVDTFMAHHQGMSLIAIANILLGGTPRRWCMGNARIEAVAPLLQEAPPREVSNLASMLPQPLVGTSRRLTADVGREPEPYVSSPR